MSLPQNEHPVDRAVRIALGLVLAGLAFVGGLAAPLIYLVWIVAALALITGIVGVCPLYAALGIGTRRAELR